MDTEKPHGMMDKRREKLKEDHNREMYEFKKSDDIILIANVMFLEMHRLPKNLKRIMAHDGMCGG